MKVIYTGSLPRPAVPQLRGVEIVRGEPVEVPDEIGVALLEQRTWRLSDPVAEAERQDAIKKAREEAEEKKRREHMTFEIGMSYPRLAPRAVNAILDAKVTMSELRGMDKTELMEIDGIGEKTATYIDESNFGPDEPVELIHDEDDDGTPGI